MPLFDHAVPRAGGFHDVTVEAVAAHGRSARLVDVREPEEFRGELGHAPGAELVPLGVIPLRAWQWPRDEAVVVICRSGNRSEQAAETLHRLGFRKVMHVVGGMKAWTARGLPTER